jgi:hypothetical protein
MGVDCGFGIPLVATKISSFIPWIDSIMYPRAKKIIENVEIKSKLNGIVFGQITFKKICFFNISPQYSAECISKHSRHENTLFSKVVRKYMA